MKYKIIDNFLSEDECDELIKLGSSRLFHSGVWNLKEGSSFVETTTRKSDQMFFAIGENDIIRSIEQRIYDLLGYPVENGEGMQMVKYDPGGFYKAHHDYFDVEYEGANREAIMRRGGQRICTVLMYLNTLGEDQGGQTCFPKVNMCVRPEKGKALIWLNTDENDYTNVDTDTLHSAEPLISGNKYILTKWIRENRFV